MIKFTLNAAVLGAAGMLLSLSTVSRAQSSVTVYGRLDVGVQTQNHTTAGDGGSQTKLNTGGIRPSIWGFRGSEDLGNGLKATFNLEGQFDPSTGALQSQPEATNTFRRQANVGIGGDWGSIQLGRQYSPLIFGTIGVEPRAWKENLSQLGTLVYAQLTGPGNPTGQGNNASNDVGSFVGNAIQYSNNVGPVYLGVSYSFGEQTKFSNGNQIAIGAAYTGPITVGFGYTRFKDANTGVATHNVYDFGVAVPFGDLTGRVNYLSAKNRDPATGVDLSDVDSVGLGLDYRWNPQNTFTVAYYDNKYKAGGGGSSKTRSLVLSNDLALSKRTTMYVQYAHEDSDAAINGADTWEVLKRTVVVDATAPAGKKTSVLNVGISHNF